MVAEREPEQAGRVECRQLCMCVVHWKDWAASRYAALAGLEQSYNNLCDHSSLWLY